MQLESATSVGRREYAPPRGKLITRERRQGKVGRLVRLFGMRWETQVARPNHDAKWTSTMILSRSRSAIKGVFCNKPPKNRKRISPGVDLASRASQIG